ncbi:hypothetical protein L218DRAFT_891932 [Marasmius fiardii PR-910]|nr:hypothetical protein L218DRAFT_891932 [Marasmius fiardii PR-910]
MSHETGPLFNPVHAVVDSPKTMSGRLTPVKLTASTQCPYTSLHYEYDPRYNHAQAENRGNYLPMAPAAFFKEFLPTDEQSFQAIPDAQKELKAAVKCSAINEKLMYPHLIRAFQHCSPTLKFVNTSNHAAKFQYGAQEVEIKPDLSGYLGTPPASSDPLSPPPPPAPSDPLSPPPPPAHSASLNLPPPAKPRGRPKKAKLDPPPAHSAPLNLPPPAKPRGRPKKAKLDPPQSEKQDTPPPEGASNLTEVEVIVEVKAADLDDPFRDTGGFEPLKGQGRDTRGQITMYATAHLGHQHRTHCFSVMIVGTYARLIRWDRAGAIVTSRFNYVRKRWLTGFFRVYGSAAPEVRGWDTSVSSLDEKTNDHYPGWQQQAREKLSLQPNQPLFLFEVRDARSAKSQKFVGTKPFVSNTHSLTGRGTRCYKVWDPETKAVFLMKDTWRVTEENVVEEGEIYSQLKEAGVRNVLSLHTYGDVFTNETRQDTKTQKFGPQGTDPLRRLRGHCHTRLVFKECGKDLRYAKTIREMVCAIRDSIIAHKDAYEIAGILHRDISVGNIIIMSDGTGRLIDWDLCQFRHRRDKGPRTNRRTGTWQFMSAKLLSLEAAEHELADDIESYFYVISWQVLKYTPHKMDISDVIDTIATVYEHVLPQIEDTPPRGGKAKKHSLGSRAMSKLEVESTAIHELLSDLEKTLAFRYEQEPSKEGFDQQRLARTRADPQSTDKEAVDELERWLYENKFKESQSFLQSHEWLLQCFDDALKGDLAGELRDNLKGYTLSAGTSRLRKNGVDIFVDSKDAEAADKHWGKKKRREEEQAEISKQSKRPRKD